MKFSQNSWKWPNRLLFDGKIEHKYVYNQISRIALRCYCYHFSVAEVVNRIGRIPGILMTFLYFCFCLPQFAQKENSGRRVAMTVHVFKKIRSHVMLLLVPVSACPDGQASPALPTLMSVATPMWTIAPLERYVIIQMDPILVLAKVGNVSYST